MATSVKKIAIVSPVVAYPSFAGNTVRVSQLLNVLEKLGLEIHFILAPNYSMYDQRSGNDMETKFGDRYYILNNGQRSRGTLINRIWTRLKKKGLNRIDLFFDYMLPWNLFDKDTVNEFKLLIDTIEPDFIIGEYALTAQLVNSITQDIPTAVETHDCFTDRNKKIRQSGGAGMWWSLTASQEKALLSIFDYVIAIQNNEELYFKKLLKNTKSTVIKLDVLEVPQKNSNSKNVSFNIGFLGSNNFHNREGLKLFVDNQWQKIINIIPNAKLLIAGDVQIDTLDKSIIKLGRVNDVFDDFYRLCTMIVNPCISGTGLKIKTVEAMSYALPVVATTEGLSGIEEANGHGAFLAELNAEEFANNCIKLLTEQEFREKQSQLAKAFIENSYEASLANIDTMLKKS